MKYLIVSILLLLSGCSLIQTQPPIEKIIYKTTPLVLPDRPTLPTFTYEDIKCVDEETITKIADRDLARKEYIEKLETIIKSTQK